MKTIQLKNEQGQFCTAKQWIAEQSKNPAIYMPGTSTDYRDAEKTLEELLNFDIEHVQLILMSAMIYK